jgi:hypothetical protein
MLRRAAWVTAVAGRLGVPVVVTEEDAAVNWATAEVIREAFAGGRAGPAEVDFRCARQPRHPGRD